MDYQLFKLLLEMSYVDTFEKDEEIKKRYEEYLKEKKNGLQNLGIKSPTMEAAVHDPSGRNRPTVSNLLA